MQSQIIELERLGKGKKPVNAGQLPVFQSVINLDISDSVRFLDVPLTIYAPDDSTPSIYTNDFIWLYDSISVYLSSPGFLTVSISDTLNAWNDSISGAFAGIYIAVGDTLTFLDNFNYLTASVSDFFTITDGPVSLKLFTLVISQDFMADTTNGNQTYQDSIQVLNQDASGNIYAPPFSDTLSISDSPTITVAIVVSVSDSITFSDAQSLAGTDQLVISDDLTITDSAESAAYLSLQLTDFFNISDFANIQKSGSVSPSLSDTLVISDAVSFALQTRLTTLSDFLTITDAAHVQLTLNLNLSDDLSLVDALTQSGTGPTIGLPFGDILTFTDSLILGYGEDILPSTINDGLNLSDSITVSLISDLNPYLRRYLNDVV